MTPDPLDLDAFDRCSHAQGEVCRCDEEMTCICAACCGRRWLPADDHEHGPTLDDRVDVAAWVAAIESGELDTEEIAEDLVSLAKLAREVVRLRAQVAAVWALIDGNQTFWPAQVERLVRALDG